MHLKNKIAFIDLSYQKGGTQKTVLYHILNFQKLEGYIFARKRSIFSKFADEIQKHGFNPILTSNDIPFTRSKRILMMKFISPKQIYLHISLLNFIRKNLHPDIRLIVGSALFSNLYAYLLSHLKGIKFIAHLDDSDLISQKKLFVVKHAKNIVVVSNFLKNKLLNMGLSEDKIHVIYPPLHNIPDIEYTHHSTPTIGFIGRLTPEKGVHIFLEILEKRRDLHGVIAGDLPEDTAKEHMNIKHKITRLQKEGRVEYLGYTHELKDVFRKINILLYPSLAQEGFGRTIIETLSAGIPVIGSRMGAIPEVLEGIPHTVTVLPTVENFINAIDLLLSQKIKPEEIRSSTLHKFSPKKSSSKFERLLMNHLN